MNDLEASGCGRCVRPLTIFPLYDGKARKISVGRDRQLTSLSLNHDVSRMWIGSVKPDSDIINNMSLNYGERVITILWRGKYHHIMERGISPYHGEGSITISWRGEYHHIMERGISPYYGEGNITILWRGEYHHNNTELFGRKSQEKKNGLRSMISV